MNANGQGERATNALVLLLPVLFAAWVLLPGWRIDNDSYYHLGVAQVLAEQGWIRTFPWLDLTVLGDEPFVDAHLLAHVFLAPFAALLPTILALQVGVVVLSSALWVSVFLVLRRRGVRHPGLWTFVGALASPFLVTHAGFLKGAGVFLVLVVWFCEALLANAPVRVFVLAWLSVYAYVGAPMLPALAITFLGVRWLWTGTWEWRIPVAAAAGLLAGLVLNPFWPGQWAYLAREMATTLSRPSHLAPGQFAGFEWISLTGRDFLRFAGLPVLAWMAVLVAHSRRGTSASAAVAAGTVTTLCLMVAALLQAKFIHHFLLLSALFLPGLASGVLPEGRRVRTVMAILALAAAAWNVRVAWVEDRGPGDNPEPAAFETVGRWLADRTGEGERVIAPWDDFPGLFLFDRHNRYVAGLNLGFLQAKDEFVFRAYYRLYLGQIQDPERLLPMYFGDARYLLARSRPRNSGERDLLDSLAQNPRFREDPSPAPAWRIFHLEPEGDK